MADTPLNTQPSTNPDGSNIYIRTMGQDVQNLNQGGGNFSPGLGAEQKPVNFAEPISNTSMDDLKQKIQDISSGPIPAPVTLPTVGYTEVTPVVASPMPTVPMTPEAPISAPEPAVVNNTFEAPVMSNMTFNPMEMPGVPSTETADSTVDPNSIPTYTKPKKSMKKLLIPVVLIIVLVLFYFLLWPKLFKPTNKVTMPNINTPKVTSPLNTTPTTTIPPVLGFSNTGDVVNSKLSIEIYGAPMLYTDVKKEANTLGTAGSIKVLQPTVKGLPLTSKEVLYTWLKNVPEALSEDVSGEYIMYTYYGTVNPAFGLVFKLKDVDSDVADAMLVWEKNKALLKDASSLWLVSPKSTSAKLFKEQEILGAKVRYFTYPGKESVLCYTIIGDKLIITTSIESMTSAIDHLGVASATTTTVSSTTTTTAGK